MTEYFEPYLATVALLFTLGAVLAWDWHWTATAGLAFAALGAAYGSWAYAHAPEIEDDEIT